jgi:N-glycosylase/DNA lyase
MEILNSAAINETISAICAEVEAQNRPQQDWHDLNEEELMFEAAVCIIGSQTAYELAMATAEHLRNSNLFRRLGADRAEYEELLVAALSQYVALRSDGNVVRWVRPRFNRRSAFLLAATRSNLHSRSTSIRQLLISSNSARNAREVLVQHVCGFGPKQASLFLRRIGYSVDLAVLDVHVLDYLQMAWDLTYKTEKLGRLPFYEHVEGEFRQIANRFGYSVGCVDLATWITMRVAKREAYI